MKAGKAAAGAWIAAAAVALSGLGGCATLPTLNSDWLVGRLSVRVDGTAQQPARSLSSAFELHGDADAGELRLLSPLGTVLAAATWSADGARLVTPSGNSRYDNLDALSREAFGEALPLRALPAWLNGKPWPAAASRTTADGFEQLGWQIGLARFADGWLDATRVEPPAVTLRARLERPA